MNLLDNPIWNALSTEHSALAEGDDYARRYPAAIGPLSGIPSQAATNYEALRPLAGPGGVIVLFSTEPPTPPGGWGVIRGGLLDQMVQHQPIAFTPDKLPSGTELRRLTEVDVPAMVELATLTEPGPFRARTHELGAFFGVFESGRLVAMAGQRLRVPESVEVSAVCTHPDARGRGYAAMLIAASADEIRQRGKTPFLHTLADNESAIRVYERLGFVSRRKLHLAVLRNDA
jgi:GNAT superfamily N-acetyltransferase